MSPRVVDKISKRQAILSKAMQVFAKRGFYDFKMIDIARAAGVGKGTLYEYFRSKTELIDGCTQLFMSDYLQYLDTRLKANRDPRHQILELIHGTFDFFAQQPERLELIFDFWVFSYRAGRDPGKIVDPEKSYEPIIKRVAGITKRGIAQGYFRKLNPVIVASMLLAMLDGLLFQSAMGLIRIDDKKLARNVSQAFLEGIQV